MKKKCSVLSAILITSSYLCCGAEVDLSEAQFRLERGLRNIFSLHSPPDNIDRYLSRVCFPELAESELVTAMQQRLGLSDEEVSSVLKTIIFGDSKYRWKAGQQGVLDVLCLPNYIDSETRDLLGNGLKEGKLWYAAYYLRVTDYELTKGPVYEIIRDFEKSNIKDRKIIYSELVRACRGADNKKEQIILASLAVFTQREASSIKDSDNPIVTSEKKGIIIRLDNFLKCYPSWANTEMRLRMLKQLNTLQKGPHVAKWDNYLSREILFLKMYLVSRRILSVLTFGAISPTYSGSLFPKLFGGTVLLLLGFLVFNKIRSVRGRFKNDFSFCKLFERADVTNKIKKDGSVLETSTRLNKRGFSRVYFWVFLIAWISLLKLYSVSYKYVAFNCLSGTLTSFDIFSIRRLFIGVLVLILCMLLIVMYMRLRNTGTSGWTSLLVFVPFFGLLLLPRCLFRQENYEETKRLDKFGIITASVMYLSVLCVVIYVTLSQSSNIADVF